MNCMKCGREIPERQVFCERCLADMERYPVDPAIPVQIPRRPAPPPAKKNPRRKQPTPEEQIRRQQRLIRKLVLTVACLTLALGLAVGGLVYLFTEQQEKAIPIGRNYTTVDSTTSPS